jgi:hypothetical protein
VGDGRRAIRQGGGGRRAAVRLRGCRPRLPRAPRLAWLFHVAPAGMEDSVAAAAAAAVAATEERL